MDKTGIKEKHYKGDSYWGMGKDCKRKIFSQKTARLQRCKTKCGDDVSWEDGHEKRFVRGRKP